MLTSFLFDRLYQFLGEIRSEKGEIRDITPSPLGAEALSEELRRWNTEGIPMVTHQLADDQKQEIQHVASVTFIKFDHAKAHHALKQWMMKKDFQMIDFEDDQEVLARNILNRDISATERVGLLEVLSHTPPSKISVWQEALSQ